MANSNPLDDDLVHAITIINDIVSDLRQHDAVAIATAHNTLARRRNSLHGPLRKAIERYLDEDTWHHGPHVLRHAVGELARQAGIPDTATALVFEQPTLF